MKKTYPFYFCCIYFFILTLLLCCTRNRTERKSSFEVLISTGTIKSGDVLENIFNKKEFDKKEIQSIITIINKNYNIKKIFPGNYYEIFYTTFNTILKLNYWLQPTEYFTVTKSTDGTFKFEKNYLTFKENTLIKEGEITDSLWNAMIKQNINPETILNYADIFSWQIDFLTEVRKGDKFKVVYKQLEYENGHKKDAEILIAQYHGSLTTEHTALYFESKDGNFKGYFTPDGKSLKKIFLRAPLNYRRVSSHFSKKRRHPILRIWRPHHGTDFVAPIGTPIVSIGSGVVEHSGWKNGYGKVVIIRHNATYKTLYGHLSKIAKGITKGIRVSQGQLIGYLGATGLATGPHLHFEIYVNNRPVNFFSLKFPPAENIPEKYKQEFEEKKQILLKYLN